MVELLFLADINDMNKSHQPVNEPTIYLYEMNVAIKINEY